MSRIHFEATELITMPRPTEAAQHRLIPIILYSAPRCAGDAVIVACQSHVGYTCLSYRGLEPLAGSWELRGNWVTYLPMTETVE